MSNALIKSTTIIASSVIAAKASFAGDIKLFASGGLLHSNDNYVAKNSDGKDSLSSINFIKNFGINISGGAQYNINKLLYVNAEAFGQYRNASASITSVTEGDASYNSRYRLGALARLGVNVNDKSSVYLGAGVSYAPLASLALKELKNKI